MIITIDGPAGSGKSTIARELSRRLGFQYLDTGAMYRAVAWRCLDEGIDPRDVSAVAEVARRVRIDLQDDAVRVDGNDITPVIRSHAVSEAASVVARNPDVRDAMTQLQRRIGEEVNAQNGQLVTEGRDQGTIVFPHAERKFFITASLEERARRRQQERSEQGEALPFSEVLDQLKQRDRRDATRDVAPLVCPDDAITIDTTDKTTDEVVEELERRISDV